MNYFLWFLIPIPFVIFQIALDFANCTNYRGDKGKGLCFTIITWILFIFGIWFVFYVFSEWPIWVKITSCLAAYVFGRVIFKLIFYGINKKIHKQEN